MAAIVLAKKERDRPRPRAGPASPSPVPLILSTSATTRERSQCPSLVYFRSLSLIPIHTETAVRDAPHSCRDVVCRFFSFKKNKPRESLQIIALCRVQTALALETTVPTFGALPAPTGLLPINAQPGNVLSGNVRSDSVW